MRAGEGSIYRKEGATIKHPEAMIEKQASMR
jgi:hypothetical protein